MNAIHTGRLFQRQIYVRARRTYDPKLSTVPPCLLDSHVQDRSLNVLLCGVDDPLNVGLVMRLLTCFGAGALRHLSYETGGDAGFWGRRETLVNLCLSCPPLS